MRCDFDDESFAVKSLFRESITVSPAKLRPQRHVDITMVKTKEPKADKPAKAPSHYDYTAFQNIVLYITLALGVLAIAISLKFALEGQLTVLQPKSINLKSLETFPGRLEFTVKYWTLPILWLYVAYHLVIFGRVFTKAKNPLAGQEYHVQASKNILTNSIEQFILLTTSQVIALPFLSPDLTLKLIPLANVWYVVGRLLFWLGYPKYRTFGMITTALSSSVAIWFAAYNFFTQFINTAQLYSFTAQVVTKTGSATN